MWLGAKKPHSSDVPPLAAQKEPGAPREHQKIRSLPNLLHDSDYMIGSIYLLISCLLPQEGLTFLLGFLWSQEKGSKTTGQLMRATGMALRVAHKVDGKGGKPGEQSQDKSSENPTSRPQAPTLRQPETQRQLERKFFPWCLSFLLSLLVTRLNMENRTNHYPQ